MRSRFPFLSATSLFLILPPLPRAAEQWIVQNPTRQESTVQSIHHASPDLAFAAGAGGTLLRSTDGGARWNAAPNATFRTLRDLHGAVPLRTFAVGDAGTVLRTIDGGATWQAFGVPTQADLHAVHFLDAMTGFAAGAKGTVIRTLNGGESWSAHATGLDSTLEAIHFPDARNGFAVGAGYRLARTGDGGSTWQTLAIALPGFSDTIGTVRFRQVHFSDARNGWLTGVHTIFYGSGKHSWFINTELLLATADGGLTWKRMPKPSRYVQWFGGERALALSGSTGLMATADGGGTWTPRGIIDSLAGALAFHFADSLRGSAITYRDGFRHTRDGGATWAASEAPGLPETDPSGDFSAVHFPTRDIGYAVGGSGDWGRPAALIGTEDGGARWTQLPAPTTVRLAAVHFLDPLTGIVAGGGEDSLGMLRTALLRTADGGKTWQDQSGGRKAILQGLHFPSARKGFAVGGNGALLLTGDGGKTWSDGNSGTRRNLRAVHFIDEETGFAGGEADDDPTVERPDGFLIRTADGGKTWQPVSIDAVPEPVTRIQFLSARIGFFMRRNHQIMKTVDGGTTWKPAGWHQFDYGDFRFISEDTGYAVGEAAFRTVDGGKSWERMKEMQPLSLSAMAMPDSRTAYAVGRFGTIAKMQNFDPTAVRPRPASPSGVLSGLGLLPGGRLAFTLPGSSRVTLLFVDPSGRSRAPALERFLPAGRHEWALPAAPCGASPCILEFRSGSFRRTLPLGRLAR